MREKFLGKDDLVDLRARIDILGLKKIVVVMKCYYRMNYFGERDRVINKQKTRTEFSRYSEKETWEYMIQCKKIMHLRIKFILEIYKQLKKI